MRQAQPFRLAILGGGFTGAVFAVHFLRAFAHPAELAIFEPRAELGRGVAYGTSSTLHRINVPSDKMFVFDEDRDHFSRWMASSAAGPGTRTGKPGRGITTRCAAISAPMSAGFCNRQWRSMPRVAAWSITGTAAARVDRLADGTFMVTGEDGSTAAADAVLVCASHAAPAFPWRAGMGADTPGLVVNPWAQGALAGLPRDGDVFIIGTGLTMADMVVSLHAAGHRGSIVAVSRRGLLPSGQGEFDTRFDLFGKTQPPRTALDLLRLVRRRAEDLANDGRAWHAAVDALRRELPRYWQTLPLPERARVVRHLRAYWDVHRYRMAPQVADLLGRARASGRLKTMCGRIETIGHDGKEFTVQWRPRGSHRALPPERTRASVVINCTGPGANPARSRNPLFRNLIDSGLAVPDPLGIGLDVAEDGTALNAAGHPVPRLLVAGPLARGRFGETMGVPDASANARMVAEALAGEALRAATTQALAG